jgi:hypothetical protein
MGFAVLIAVALLQLGFLASQVLYPDLVLHYPFQTGDSPDWIANGLYLAGHDVRYSARAPLLPLAIAALDRCATLRYLPLLPLTLFHGTVLVLYRALARIYRPAVAFATALATLLNVALVRYSLDLMADLSAACLLLLSLERFIAAGRAPRHYLAAGLLGGLSCLVQPAAALLPLPCGLLVLAHRRSHLRGPAAVWLWTGTAAGAALPLAWVVIKRLVFGVWGDLQVPHWRLVAFHLDEVVTYTFSWVGLVGIPAAAMGAWGVVRVLRRQEVGDLVLTAALATGALVGFFVFFYAHGDRRLLIYGALPAAVLIAHGLDGLRVRLGRWVAAVLVVAGSLLPTSAGAVRGSEVPLWPWPYRVLRVAEPGMVTSKALAVRLLHPDESWLERLPHYQAHQLRRGFVAADVPEPVPEVRGVMLLHGRTPWRSLREARRLQVALRKRTTPLSQLYLAPFWGLVGLEPQGSVMGRTALRAQVQGIEGEWLFLLHPSAREPPLRQPLEVPEEELEHELAVARRIAGWVRPGDPRLVFVVAAPTDRRLARLFLPFLLLDHDLVLRHRREDGSVPGLAPGLRVAAEEEIGGIRVMRMASRQERAPVVIEFPAPDSPHTTAALPRTAGSGGEAVAEP